LATDGGRPEGGRTPGPGSARAVGVVAVALVLAAAWRATLGMSFMDDGYYAAATLRLAQGAHIFVDEMFLQSLGLLAAVPFAKLWTALFSTAGLVVALRLFYVALASVAGYAIYRALLPSFGRWPSLAAAVAPLLAPAYNLLAVTYDTMAVVGMVLATVWAFAALRDGSRRWAAAAGAAAAFGSISYPPLALAALTLLATFSLLARGRRLVLPMVAGAAAVAVPFLVWLATQATLGDLQVTANYLLSASRATGPLRPEGRLGPTIAKLWTTLQLGWGVPLWVWFAPSAAIGVTVALPVMRAPARSRVRGYLLASLPLAVALPALASSFIFVGGRFLGTYPGNYLTAFVLMATVPLLVEMRGMGRSRRDLVVLALPMSVVGMLVVISLSSASLYWGSQIVGLAPLAMAVVACWASAIWESAVPAVGRFAPALLVVALVVLLFGSAFDQPSPLTLRTTIRTGAFAGVTTSAVRAGTLAELERLGSRWVRPGDGVTFVTYPGGYLAVPSGVPLTNATWLDRGPADGAAVVYFDRTGRWPDVVFLPTWVADAARAPGASPSADPLAFELARRYRVAETSPDTGLTVLTRR
jgi:hypothetical protein